ncbi:MAG: APC family permease [Calditrichia bacterium]
MTSKPTLPRVLNRFDAAMMIMGNMIGIGIFTTTGYFAGEIGSPFLALLVWVIGGCYVFCGAVTYAELATRFPRAGGDYNYLGQTYHPMLGFLFGWSTFLVTYTGSIAAIAIGFAAYFLRLLPADLQTASVGLAGIELSMLKLVAIGITFILTLLNTRGVERGSLFQNGMTLLGVTTLVAMIIFGLMSGNGNPANFQPFMLQQFDFETLSSLGVAMVGVIFTFAGWTVIAYIAEEVKEPQRTIPQALAGAVLLVATLYLLTNVVYIYAQPLSSMSGTIEVGFQTLTILFGNEAGFFFSMIIILMVASSLNATVLSGPRIYFAMARDGYFFKWAGELHPKHQVPWKGLWIQFGWVVLMILFNKFNELLSMLVVVTLLCGLLSGSALVVQRLRNPNPESAYSAWGYPVTTGIYLLLSLGIMLNLFYKQPKESLIGLAIVATGIPFYLWWKNKQNQVRNSTHNG